MRERGTNLIQNVSGTLKPDRDDDPGSPKAP